MNTRTTAQIEDTAKSKLEDTKSKAESELREEVLQLKEDLAAIREDFRDVVGGAVRTGKYGVESAAEVVKTAAKSAADKSCEIGRDAVHKAEDQVVAHPFSSVATAFVGGALLGAYLGRSRS